MICIASDHAGYELKEHIKHYLESKGIKVKDMGTHSLDSVHYPTYGELAAKEVSEGRCDKAIIVCGTGLGISMAASKLPGVRCALCTNTFMAEMARQHNDANILALGARVIGMGVAEGLVDTFLETPFEGGRHGIRVDMIGDIEKKYNC